MTGNWKRTVLALISALVLVMGCFSAAFAEDGAEPYGDGDGVIDRATLAGLYNWIRHVDSEFMRTVTFDMISEAVGKPGFVKEKDRDEYHAAYWTDGEKYVTVTFRNRDGFWGVTSITTDIRSEEYSEADYSAFPAVGNRAAGSSPTESVTLKAKLNPASEEVLVTVQVPVENWTTASSFGEARILNLPDPSRASGNSAGLRITFFQDEAALLTERAKGEDVRELEDLSVLGTVMKGAVYQRYGMETMEYALQLREDIWLCVRFYNVVPYAGSEAEAILNSLVAEYGDFTFAGPGAGTPGAEPEDTEAPAATPTAASGTEPAGTPEAEPAAAPTVTPETETGGTPPPAAERSELTEEETAFAGTWYLLYSNSGGMAFHAKNMGLENETLTLNPDHSCLFTMTADQGTESTWGMEEDGFVRANGMPVMLLEDGFLQYGTEAGGYMIFSQDKDAQWDGSVLLYERTVEASATPTPKPTPEPTQAPAQNNGGARTAGGSLRMDVKYTAKTYTVTGLNMELNAESLGGEYSVVLHADGTVHLVLAGSEVPGLTWEAEGDDAVINFYEQGIVRVSPDGDGAVMDYMETLVLKMTP